MSLRAVIVDDEPLARERIRSLLRTRSDVDVLAEVGDGHTAVETLVQHNVDLLFLDVQMPEKDGFEVLAMLEARRETTDSIQIPAVVFVTAYDRYAIRAFEVHAIDYLLKPFDAERFERTLDRVVAELAEKNARDRERRLRAVLSDRFVVKSRGRVTFVSAADIDWVESAGNYVTLHVGGRTHLIRDTMTAVEARLDPQLFARIHRTAIVRLDRVRELTPAERGDYEAVLEDGARVPVSRRYYADVRQLLERLSAESRDDVPSNASRRALD